MFPNHIYVKFGHQVETHYEEERERVQSQLMKEQNELLDKYKEREVGGLTGRMQTLIQWKENVALFVPHCMFHQIPTKFVVNFEFSILSMMKFALEYQCWITD